jgi:hypothetical protein
MKNKLFVIFMAFCFVVIGCATVDLSDITLTPTINTETIGIVLRDTTIGRFNFNAAVFTVHGWKFELISGDGDINNASFEIDDNNMLIARQHLMRGNYSILVNMKGAKQHSGGIRKVFTVTVAGDLPVFPPELQRFWYKNDTAGRIFGVDDIKISENHFSFQGGVGSYDLFLVAKSGDSYILMKSEGIGELLKCDIRLENETLVISNADSPDWSEIFDFYQHLNGTYRKELMSAGVPGNAGVSITFFS